MGINDENEHCEDCSKDDEKKEEINEVQMAINDYTNDYNKNKHVILKSKKIDADKLSEIAIKRLKELHEMDTDGKKEKGTHFG